MGILTPEGYVKRNAQQIRDLVFEAWRSKPPLGPTFLDSNDTPQAAIADTFAELLAIVEEAIAAAFGATSRAAAVGQQADNLGDIIGVARRMATRSRVTATVNLDSGATLVVGSQAASSTNPQSIYRTIEEVINTEEAAADFLVEMEAVEPGANTFVVSGDLTQIVTPSTGWNSVTNALDASPGMNTESLEAYKLRQTQELSVAGSGTVASIRSAVSTVPGVVDFQVFENVNFATDANGVPGKSFMVVVLGGGDDDIAQAIWDNKPVGILSFGGNSGTAIDDVGQTQTMEFVRPVEREIFVEVQLTTGVGYPGDAAMKEAVVLSTRNAFGIGQNVVYSELYKFLFAVPGVLDVSFLRIGLVDPPASTSNITISATNVSVFDTSRIERSA